MTQLLEHYYANELQYLADAGREFSQQHPQQAALLNPDNVEARDPQVERLFENFAFLTANLRAKLEDELPELSQPLLGLLCPPYVRPVPALATVQLWPDFAQLTEVTEVQAGSFVKSKPMALQGGLQQLSCSFRSCYPVALYPLELVTVRQCGPVQGCDGIELTFERRGTAKWEQLPLDRIRLYLRGETHQLVYSLYYYLMHRVARLECGAADSRPARIEAVGFAREDEVIPYDRHTFPGFRLVQEYFCFPGKFFYVDLCGLSQGLRSPPSGVFPVRVWFDGETPAWWNLSKQNFCQFCTPVINLVPEHAFPIDFDQRMTDYPLYVDKTMPDAFQVHSINSVVGRPRGELAAEPRVYESFFGFRHDHGDGEPYYYSRWRSKGASELEWTLALTTSDGSSAVLPEQVLAVDVQAFNGDYPSRLRPGDVCFRDEEMTQLVQSVRNLEPPTPVRWPPREAEAAWHFISHAALNHLSIADVKALSGLLHLYDWTGDPANKRRLAGLVDARVRDQRALIIRQGMPVQGLELELTLDESCYTDVGDAYLFGQVLRHFSALYATINSFVRLRLHCAKSKEEWLCPALDGRQMTI